MSPKEMESKSTGKVSNLEVIKKDDNGDFIVKDQESGNICTIEDTFAETCSHMVTIHSDFR
jgi:hypothetical protein